MDYVDHLQEYMREKAKRFTENIQGHYPAEILKLRSTHPDRLVELLTEGATPILRGMEDYALDMAMVRLVISIRWSKQQAKTNKVMKLKH